MENNMEMQQDIKAAKKKLRKEVFERIRQLDPLYATQADLVIVDNLLKLPEYEEAKTVFCFVGTETEIDTVPFLKRVLSDGKTLTVPLCIRKGIMEAREIKSLDELKRGYYDILEPADTTPVVDPETIDLAIIPCVSCNHAGARLGHGGGFYDIFFSEHTNMKTVMICREQITTEEIPAEEHDLVFDKVVTEAGVFSPL